MKYTAGDYVRRVRYGITRLIDVPADLRPEVSAQLNRMEEIYREKIRTVRERGDMHAG